MVAMVDRERMLNVRVSEGEIAMLAELAEHMGLSKSDAVRQLLRRAHAEAFGIAKPSKRQRRKR